MDNEKKQTVIEPQLQEHGYTPTDEIRPELIPLIDQWAIDKTAAQVDRLIEGLSKKTMEA